VVLQLDGSAFDAKLRVVAGVALGKKAAASNVYQNNPAFDAAKALDGDDLTRWATDQGVHEAWLEVDLGRPVTVSSAFLSEAYDRVEQFELLYQRDGQWLPFASGDKIGDALELTFPPVSVQLVRLNVLKATDGPTIWEFRLFEPKK
jgi:alpha-L-fucosidase